MRGVLFIMIVINQKGKLCKVDMQMVVKLPTDTSSNGRKIWVSEFDARYVIVIIIDIVIEQPLSLIVTLLIHNNHSQL